MRALAEAIVAVSAKERRAASIAWSNSIGVATRSTTSLIRKTTDKPVSSTQAVG